MSTSCDMADYENQAHKLYIEKQLQFHQQHYNAFSTAQEIIELTSTSWVYAPENPNNSGKSAAQISRQYFDEVASRTMYFGKDANFGQQVWLSFSTSHPSNAGKTADQLFAEYQAYSQSLFGCEKST